MDNVLLCLLCTILRRYVDLLQALRAQRAREQMVYIWNVLSVFYGNFRFNSHYSHSQNVLQNRNYQAEPGTSQQASRRKKPVPIS